MTAHYKNNKNGWTSLHPSQKDLERARNVPNTPQSLSSSYRLAWTDEDFLTHRAMRPVRLQLELLKPEMILMDHNISSTVVMFGGARIPDPTKEASVFKDKRQQKNLKKNSIYYEEARKFAQICSEHSKKSDYREFVVVTGGGPGVMEAGNRGAYDVGAPSIGLNIVLPNEQAPNPYVTPDLCFNFHYFAIRKMHFVMRAKAFIIFPGGFGTLDEFFETLTLIQTGRMKPVPIVLFGRSFWERTINFDYLAEQGMIFSEDKDIIDYAETGKEAWEIVERFHKLAQTEPT